MTDRNPKRRQSWSQPLADIVAPCLSPALARFGFGEADLLMFWPEIVGERLAARCEPLRLQWPTPAPAREKQEPATLIVRVESAFAPELQHQDALVIERINRHLGWRCVGRLALRQGPLSKKPPKKFVPPPISPDMQRRADALAYPIKDKELRAALSRLGARVLSAHKR